MRGGKNHRAEQYDQICAQETKQKAIEALLRLETSKTASVGMMSEVFD